MNHPKIEIMDTTLRDGEQTSGVSFVPHEKLMIARLLLEELKVDRVEVASARVSDGEADAVRMICDWAALPRHQPAVQGLAEALHLPAEEDARGAHRRHTGRGGLCRRARHGGQRLP